jgi:hypothetical protein
MSPCSPRSPVCAILTGDDLDVPAPSDFFARYPRGLVAGREEARRQDERQAANMLGHAIVAGCVAYWPMRRKAFGCGSTAARRYARCRTGRSTFMRESRCWAPPASRGFTERKEVTTIKVNIEIRDPDGCWRGVGRGSSMPALVISLHGRHCGRQHI